MNLACLRNSMKASVAKARIESRGYSECEEKLLKLISPFEEIILITGKGSRERSD